MSYLNGIKNKPSFTDIKKALIERYEEAIRKIEEEYGNGKSILPELFEKTMYPINFNNVRNGSIIAFKDRIKFLNEISDIKITLGKNGNIYKSLIPDNDELLNWDAPLSEQSEKIMPAIKKAIDIIQLNIEKPNMLANRYSSGLIDENNFSKLVDLFSLFENKVQEIKFLINSNNQDAYAIYDNAQLQDFIDKTFIPTIRTLLKRETLFDIDIGKIISTFANDYDNVNIQNIRTGGDLYCALTKIFGGTWRNNSHPEGIEAMEKASMYLDSLGIPGHCYLDRLSRGKQSGTHNFVIWNDKYFDVVNITKDSDLGARQYFSRMKKKLESAKPNDIDLDNLNDKDFLTDEQITRYNQRGYHGTGHIILGNKFDLSYSLSGEGSQYRGHGVYIGEALAIGEFYRRFGLPAPILKTKDGKTFALDKIKGLPEDKRTPETNRVFTLLNAIVKRKAQNIDDLRNFHTERLNNLENRLEYAQNYAYTNTELIERLEADIDEARELLKFIDNIADIEVTNKNGNIYELEIPENDVLLDWDADMSNQPSFIKKAVKKIKAGLKKNADLQGIDLSDIDNAQTGGDFYFAIAHAIQEHYLHKRGLTMETAERKLEKRLWEEAKKATSHIFNQFGVPGLRFFDKASRAEKNYETGTHNFVIWNVDTIEILGLREDSDQDAKDYFAEMQARLKNTSPKNVDLTDDSGIVSDTYIEHYNQNMWHATGAILLGNTFDMNRVGLGDGTQHFGHGAYLSETTAVPEEYRKIGIPMGRPIKLKTKDGQILSVSTLETWDKDILKNLKKFLTDSLIPKIERGFKEKELAQDIFIDTKNENINSSEANKELAQKILAEAKRDFRENLKFEIQDLEDAIFNLEDKLEQEGNITINGMRLSEYINNYKKNLQEIINEKPEILAAVDNISDIEVGESRKGNIYLFDGPENDILLNWDESLENQPTHVKKAINKIKTTIKRRVKFKGLNISSLNSVKTGGDLYRAITAIMREYEKANGNSNIDSILLRRLAEKDTSNLFGQFGIPGHRYFDIISLKRGKNIHNFCIWDKYTLKLLGLTEDSDDEAKDYFERTKAEMQAKLKNSSPEKLNPENSDNLVTDKQIEKYNQTSQILHNENEEWSNLIDKFIEKKLSKSKDGNLFHVMKTPIVYKLTGMDILPIKIRLDNINKILHKKHNIRPETLKQIPAALADPIMIFKSEHDASRDRNSRVILTELREKGSNGEEYSVIAAITLGKIDNESGYAINELTTVYKKDKSSKQQLSPDEDIFDWIARKYKNGSPMNLLLYINKEKAVNRAISSGLSPMVFDIIDSLPDSIPNENDLAKLINKTNKDNDENNESYNQIIGEDGATRLDESEGVTTRIDNLNIAKEMERLGFSHNIMWAATGWIRGTENKWRMEIPDGEVIKHTLKELYKLNKEYKELLNLRDDTKPNYGYKQEQIERLKELKRIVEKTPLSSVFTAPKLFKAYPDIQNINVKFDDSEDWVARYNPHSNKIWINFEAYKDSNAKEIRNIFLHEIQHAIQFREVFAAGGSSKMFRTNKDGKVNINPFLRNNAKRRIKFIFENLTPEIRKKFRQLRRQETKLGGYKTNEFLEVLHNILSKNDAKKLDNSQ